MKTTTITSWPGDSPEVLAALEKWPDYAPKIGEEYWEVGPPYYQKWYRTTAQYSGHGKGILPLAALPLEAIKWEPGDVCEAQWGRNGNWERGTVVKADDKGATVQLTACSSLSVGIDCLRPIQPAPAAEPVLPLGPVATGWTRKTGWLDSEGNFKEMQPPAPELPRFESADEIATIIRSAQTMISQLRQKVCLEFAGVGEAEEAIEKSRQLFVRIEKELARIRELEDALKAMENSK